MALGSPYCTGYTETYYENGPPIGDRSSPIQTVSGGTNWLQHDDAVNNYQEISVGNGQSAAIKTDGTLWLWGSGSYGSLGNNSTISQSSPVQTISGGTNWKQVSAGDAQTAAIKTDGSLWLWGYNYYGILGNNSTIWQSSPVQTISGGTNWKQVSMGDAQTAAIKTDGTLWVWGYGQWGAIGNGVYQSHSSPVQTISGGTDWKQVSTGSNNIAAIKTNGTLWLWGMNDCGQLGNNSSIDQASPVQTISGGTNWKQVSLGTQYAAAIKTDGTLWGFGNNRKGQLGRDDGWEFSSPVQTISGGTNWKQVSAASVPGTYAWVTYAIKCDGSLWGFGSNSSGSAHGAIFSYPFGCNEGFSSPVQTVSGGTDWKSVATSAEHTLAIKCDGSLWGWGNNGNGELGINTFIYTYNSPVQVINGNNKWKFYDSSLAPNNLNNWQELSGAAAIKTDGTLWLWGDNSSGNLGDNSATNRSSPVQTISGGNNWKQVSRGGSATGAIKTDGSLWMWGNNTNGGQLGNCSTITRSSPVQTISGGTNWKQVSVGFDVAAAIKTDGTLWTWGSGLYGGLGNNSVINQSSPVQTISSGTTWKQVSAGGNSMAAIKCDGSLWTWGSGTNGRLGNNSTFNQSSPVQTISGGNDWKQVASGYEHFVAIKTDGSLWYWGNGDAFMTYSSPVQTVSGGNDWKQASGGLYRNIAVKANGSLWTWGSGNHGQLGNNTTNDTSSPVQTISGGNDWKQASIDSSGIVSAIKTDGTLWVWGDGVNSGGVGDGSSGIDRSSPVQNISNETKWRTDIDADDGYYPSAFSLQLPMSICPGVTIILDKNKQYRYIGYDNGGILSGFMDLDTSGHAYYSSDITNFNKNCINYDWKQISPSIINFAGIKTDGTLWLWGWGACGTLGNCSTIDQSSPVQTISGGTNWKQVSISDFNAAAIKTDGTLWLWGDGTYGQLGNNSLILQSSPVQTISGGTNWKQVSINGSDLSASVAAIKTDGTLWLWGDSTNGQLGNGNFIDMQSSPVQTISGGTNWKQVSVGKQFGTAAIKCDGTLWLWGDNNYGQLGNNSDVNQASPVQTISGGTNWKQVSAGRTTAAIKTDGTLWAWGGGSNGNLGNNSTISQSSPVQTISGGTDWRSVGKSDNHATLAFKCDGSLWGWGAGWELGHNVYGENVTCVPIMVVDYYKPVGFEYSFNDGYNGYDKQDIDYQVVTQSAAIKTDGTLWLWGGGSAGTLGNNSTIDQSSPVQTISGGTNWKQVVSFNYTTAAIKSDGSLWMWGSGTCGQLGNCSTAYQSSPVQTISGGTNWKQVSLGCRSAAAIKTDGTLWSWGYGFNGQLGNCSTIIQSSPVQTISGGTNWKQVGVGSFHTAAIKTDGTLWTWGWAYGGALGNCSTIDQSSPVQTISGGTNWKQVSVGPSYNVAIKTDGSLWLWGCGQYGKLGNNSTINQSSPVQTISGGTNWKQVSAGCGGFSTAAIKTDGTLWVWGDGLCGQLGNCSTAYQSSPVQTISGGTDWKQVSSAIVYTAIKTDGTLWAWGGGSNGNLGNNSTISQSSPVQQVIQPDWKFDGPDGVEYGEVSGAAAIKCDGTLWLWGQGDVGQLGNGNNIYQSSPVQTISGGTNWKQVSRNCYRTAAIKTDGTLWMWGDGGSGGLGNNSTANQLSPVQTISGGNNWKQVSAGRTTATIKTDGTLWTWGYNVSGTLGNNSTVNQSSPVQTISGGTNWKQVSVGENRVYTLITAIKCDGSLWLWGENALGQLGNNSVINQSSPVQTISGGTNWKQVSSGGTHTVSIKTDGTLWSWGCNYYGTLGNNSISSRSSPVQTISGGTNWKQVSATSDITFAVKCDGTMWSWGYGFDGTHVNYSTVNQSSPVQTISGGTNWKQVSAGIEDTALDTTAISAIKTDGTLWTWGRNADGSLGNNSTIDQSSPVQVLFTPWRCDDWEDSQFDELSSQLSTSAAIKTDGSLWTWGCNISGTLGNNSTVDQSSPVQTISGGTNWKQVSVGYSTIAAIKIDGSLWTWGCGASYVLGNGGAINQSSPVQTVSGGTNWKHVSVGFDHVAAVGSNDTLWMWGGNGAGQIGNNSITTATTPQQLGSYQWDKITAGFCQTSAIRCDGTLWLWGLNSAGELGNNSTNSRSSPVQTISGGTNWKQISNSGQLNAAIKTDGSLWLWGVNLNGKLGTNSTIDRSSPVQTISGGTDWKQVEVGSSSVSAVKCDGTLWVWGCNGAGRLGINSTEHQSSPVQTISGGTNWKQVVTGNSNVFGVKCDGTLWTWGTFLGAASPVIDTVIKKVDLGSMLVEKSYLLDVYPSLLPQAKGAGLWGWGDNTYGTLGNNSTVHQSSPVQTISGGTNWKQVSASSGNTAVVKTDGTLWLWGLGGKGYLGNCSTIDQSSPVQTISGGTNWKQVSAGDDRAAAIKTDGSLWLWGSGTGGVLGNNSTISQSSPVQTISSGTCWKQVSGGGSHTAAIKTDGSLWLWGSGLGGSLGNCLTINQSSPVQTISSGTNWKQVSGGGCHVAAIKCDGTLWLWGCNYYGVLGNNSNINQSSPVQTVSGGTDWKQVSGGGSHTAAIKTDGTLWSWGLGANGTLGNNSINNQSSPVQTITGGTNWKQVSGGGSHTAAIKTDGSLWLWGLGANGRLGNNSINNQSSPVQTITGGTNWKQVSAGWATFAIRDVDDNF